MKKYDKVEITYTVSIDNKAEEAAAKKIFAQGGSCRHIPCEECPLKVSRYDCLQDMLSHEEIVDVLRLMGVK